MAKKQKRSMALNGCAQSMRNPLSLPCVLSCSSPIEALELRIHLSTVSLSSGVAENQALTTNSSVQQNPSIAVDPLNSKHLVASYMDYSLLTTGYAGIGVAVSENDGKTWSRTDIPLPADFDQGAATPVTQFDAQGNVYVSFSAATFLGTEPGLTDADYSDREAGDGFTSNNGIFVAKSTDGGLAWHTPVAVVSHLYDGTDPVLFEVTPDLAIDTFAKLPDGKPNPSFGNMYEVWTRNYTPGTFPGEPTFTGGTDGMIAVSKDEGATWTIEANKHGVTAIDDPVRSLSDGGPGLGYVDQVHVTVGPEGDVYVSDYGGGDFSVLHSTDAGQTFAAPDHSSNDRLAFGAGFNTYEDSTLGDDQFRTNSLRDIVADPSRPGVVYAVDTVVNSDGSTDVYFARSSDYGVHWSSSFTVGNVAATVLDDVNGGVPATSTKSNQIPGGDAFARLQVAPNGDLAVIWYDTRVDPASTALNVFATVSTDGGLKWSKNFRISDSTFDPNAGVFTDAAGNQDYYLGDFIGLTLTDSTAYATWTDTRTGNQDVYFTSFSLNPAPAALNDRFEPNNTAAQATSLGTIVTDTVPQLDITSGDQDWYSFSPTAAGQMSLEAVQTVASTAHLQLQLYDSTGTTLLATAADVTNAEGSVVGEQISAPGVSGTTYLLRVAPIRGGTTYSLQLQCLTQNLGTQVYGAPSGVLEVGQQNDYLLTTAAAGTLDVQLTPGSDATGNFSLNVLSANGQSTLASGTASGSDQIASLSVSQGQSLLLEVSGDETGAGSYGLTFSDLDQNTVAASSTVVPAGTDPSQSVVADLTGKGKQDIVVADADSDTVSVLLNNGNGTFQSPREYAVGPYGSTALLNYGLLPNFRRSIAVEDFNGDGIPDIVVTNYASGDVSVLLGNGDGTFQPQRRFNAVADPFDLAVGDLTGNGIDDIVVISANTSPGTNTLQQTVGVLLGRGDGTFLPPLKFNIDLPVGDESPLSSIRIADVNGDGIPDLIVSGGSDSLVRIFLGNGNGTFRTNTTFTGAQLGTALLVADINGDSTPDIITASFGDGSGYFFTGNGDGTFSSPQDLYTVGQSPVAIALGDVGSVATDGSDTLGPPDGDPDLIIANSGVQLGSFDVGTPDVVVLPSEYSDGAFEGYGNPVTVYTGIAPEDVSVGDFNGDGMDDIAVTDTDGIHIIYTGTPTIVPNDTPQTALNLGSVTHVAEPTLAISPGHEDAYFNLTAPVEADSDAGDEVLDFSGLFQHQLDAGLTMELLNAAGQVLASGARFRVSVPQGEALTLHVQGTSADAAGAYTLDIDALPQVVSVAAQTLTTGTDGESTGPTSSLVVTFQGERLDAAAAEDAANYQVIYLGADGNSAPQTIPLGSGASVIYDPGANLDVTTGKQYPTAVKQTVTLLFDQPLAAGSYEIDFSPNIVSSPLSSSEISLLADASSVGGHGLISVVNGSFVAGAKVLLPDLVPAAGGSQTLSGLASGTPLLAQLHSDLNAILDSQLSQGAGDSAVTEALLEQLMKRFEPDLLADGLPPLLLAFLDPVSLNLADPSGNHVSYNLQTNALSNQVPDAFVSVTGNVEVLVLPILSGTYNLDVSDVPSTARGGVAILGADSQQSIALTDDLRDGQQDFTFGLPPGFAAAQVLSELQQTSSVVTTSSTTSDDQTSPSSSSDPTTGTASANPPSDQTASPPVANTAVAVSDDSLTVDASQEPAGPNQADRKNGKRRAHPADAANPVAPRKVPTSKPADKTLPTARASAEQKTPPNASTAQAVAAARLAAAATAAAKSMKAPIEVAKPLVAETSSRPQHVVVVDSPVDVGILNDRHQTGLVAASLFSAQGVAEMANGKKKRRRSKPRRRRA